jgi:Ran GTPase-activating protein (RanGAP) involved in mRNA processing and transport
MITSNMFVTHLDLSDNLLGESSPEVARKLAKALLFNASIKHLGLAKNRLGPDFGRALAKTLCENSTLTSVDVTDNRFDSTVGNAMRDMLLKANKTLLSLNITGEPALNFVRPAIAVCASDDGRGVVQHDRCGDRCRCVRGNHERDP